MSKFNLLLPIVVAFFMAKTLCGQPLVINNSSAGTGIYIVFNGGTSATPIYMVVNNSTPATTDIKRINGSNPGWIISEGQYRYTKWMIGATNASFVLPFGYGTTDYLPFTFNKTSGNSNVSFSTWATNNQNVPRAGASDAGSVAAVRQMTGPNGADSLTSVIDRWWDIYAPAAVTADLTFSYRGAENTMSINPTLLIDAQHWNGTQWDPPLTGNGNGVTGAGVGSTTVTGATTFSPWILIAKNFPLPVEFLYFTAFCLEDMIQIDWATATESNADYFTIEKSADGVNFRELTTVPAQGNSATISQYTYTDTQIESSEGVMPVWYYRLLETDYDGKTNTFETVAVKPCSEETLINEINAWPVGSGFILVKIINGTGKGDDFNAEIFDIGSKNIFSEKLHAATGVNHFVLNTGQVAAGLYVIRIVNDYTNYSKKLILH